MATPLRVLIVEDSQDDVVLLVRELRRNDYDVVFQRVETAETMKEALDKQTWDIVISDYVLPQFNGLAALRILKERDLDLPFIIVSGKIGEETAVVVMKSGAHDYIMKDNLTRLALVVKRELNEFEERRERKQAEKALKESEERYRTLFEKTLNPILIIDAEGNYLDCNESSTRFFECRREELMTKKISDFVLHGKDKNLFNAHKPLWINVHPLEIEYFIHGKPRFLELTISSGMWHGKRVFFGIGNDITERKKKEEEERENENRLKTLASDIPGASYRRACDSNWTIVFLSEGIKKISGFPSSDFINNNARTYASIIHPDDRKVAEEIVLKEINQRKPYFIEYRVLNADGNVHWVYEKGQGVTDKDGNLLWLDGVIFDIT